MLAIVTFDLHGAKTKNYEVITEKMSQIGLEKTINSPDDKKPIKLPANTYAGEFKGKKKDASELRDKLRKAVGKQIKKQGLSAEVFVVVGTGWSWGRRKVKPRRIAATGPSL